MLGGSGAAGMSGASGAAGAGCVVPFGAWTGEGRYLVFEAECARGPDVGECDGCTQGSSEGVGPARRDPNNVSFGEDDYLMYEGLDLDVNPYAFEYMACETWLVEPDTNPYYPDGLCGDPATNLSSVVPDTCIDTADGSGIACPTVTFDGL